MDLMKIRRYCGHWEKTPTPATPTVFLQERGRLCRECGRRRSPKSPAKNPKPSRIPGPVLAMGDLWGERPAL